MRLQLRASLIPFLTIACSSPEPLANPSAPRLSEPQATGPSVSQVERDHPQLIDACARLLAPGGLIVFSTNAQRFRIQKRLRERYAIRDISAATLPKDFERNPRIHRCYEVQVGPPVRD